MHKFIFFCLDILQFIWVVTIYGEAVTLDGSWTLFLQNSAPSLPPKSTTHMDTQDKESFSIPALVLFYRSLFVGHLRPF